MKKIALSLLFSLACFGAEVSWMSLGAAKAAAKKENKILMVEVSAHGCKYCVEMASTTLKDEKIVNKINANFAPVLFYLDSEKIPSEFAARGTPTFFFVDKNGKRLSPPIFGAWNVQDFDSFLDAAIRKSRE